MTTQTWSVLGRGIYDLSEAARYAELHANTVYSWFNPRGRMVKSPVFASDYARSGVPIVLSFLNLVEILVVGQFRRKGVPLQEIRGAYDLLRKDLKTNHPFSHKHLYAHGRKVFAKVADGMSDTMLYEVVKRQGFSEELMKTYLERIDYSESTLMAERWRIAQGIVIDPGISFGQPTIEGKGTTTQVLAKAYYANTKDANFVASLYGVSDSDVKDAVVFEERFGLRKAA